MSEETETSVKGRKLNVKSIILILILVLSVGSALYFWQDARDARSQTPEAIATKNQEETTRVLSSLDELLLTESETDPTVARIEDADVLRGANEEFYKNAQNGDYLVLYPQRAIIYREAESLVVNVAPIINTADIQPQEEPESDEN